MASSTPPNWLTQPPTAFDLVAARFPETKPKGELRLRPCLVLNVLRGKADGAIACRLAYGTKHLKFIQRKALDIIVQNHDDLDAMGLPMATRFDLDEKNVVILPWNEENFGCWSGYQHPKIGALSEEYIKNYAFIMALRQANKTA